MVRKVEDNFISRTFAPHIFFLPHIGSLKQPLFPDPIRSEFQSDGRLLLDSLYLSCPKWVPRKCGMYRRQHLGRKRVNSYGSIRHTRHCILSMGAIHFSIPSEYDWVSTRKSLFRQFACQKIGTVSNSEQTDGLRFRLLSLYVKLQTSMKKKLLSGLNDNFWWTV